MKFNSLSLVILGALFVALLSCEPGTEVKKLAFEHRIIDPDPPSANEGYLDVAAVGDLDGDGIEDIMIGSQFTTGAVWYHSPTWERYPIGPGDFTTDGEIADIDNDGDADLVMSTDSKDRVEWWENTGDPLQGGWVRHDIGSLFAHDMAVADVNGDGRQDVAVFSKYGRVELTVYLNPGSPDAAWQRIAIAEPEGEGLDLGDLDGDGDVDLTASRTWYENVDGDGKTWTVHTIVTNWGVDCRNICYDMNTDGKVDVVMSHSEGEGGLSWFENPDWTEHKIEPGILVGAHTLEIGDFDSDGDPDVFTGEMHTSPEKRVLVYENLGNDTWQRMVVDTAGTHNGRIGDIDGDGDIDLIGKNYDGRKVVEVWLNTLTSK